MDELPDQEFVNTLRAAVAACLEAVDRWETAYRKYYRMPGHELTISSDMEAEQQEYEARRRLESLLPRAGRLCLKHNLRNPFPGLLRTSLASISTANTLLTSISSGGTPGRCQTGFSHCGPLAYQVLKGLNEAAANAR